MIIINSPNNILYLQLKKKLLNLYSSPNLLQIIKITIETNNINKKLNNNRIKTHLKSNIQKPEQKILIATLTNIKFIIYHQLTTHIKMR